MYRPTARPNAMDTPIPKSETPEFVRDYLCELGFLRLFIRWSKKLQ